MVDIEVLRQLGSIRRLKKGDFLFKQGDSGSEMFIILSGKVNILSEGTTITAELAPGNSVGEMSIFENMPHIASALASKDTIVLAIEKNNFQNFISKQPAMAYKIMEGLSARVRLLSEEIASLKPLDNCHGPAAEQAEVDGVSTDFPEILFPEGHKNYHLPVPAEHQTYLLSKTVKCPVCGHTFEAVVPRMSKLKLDRTDNDFRRHYVDFETLWYNIWSCPKCYYSSFNYDFGSLTHKLAKKVYENLEELKDLVSPVPSNPTTIDHVFTSYYLSLYCANAVGANPIKHGKLWLQLSWLYSDCDDRNMARSSSLNALENYHNAFYNSSLNISSEEEQQCCIIIAELNILKGDLNEAAKHFHKAIKRGDGSPAMNQQAQDRIQDLKTIPRA